LQRRSNCGWFFRFYALIVAKGEIGMKKVYIKIGYALNLICNAKVYSKANMSRFGCEKVYTMLALSESSALCPLLHSAGAVMA